MKHALSREGLATGTRRSMASVLSATGLALVSVLASGVAAEANDIGDCILSGEVGSIKLQPVNEGVLTVETALPNPGWWNGDTPEQITTGFEYCLAANVAHRAGLKEIRLVIASFPAMIANVNPGKDMAMATISITAERQKVMQFTAPYFNSDIGILVKKGTAVDAAAMKTFRVGVLQGSTGAKYVADEVKPAELREYPENPAILAALMAGQIDAAVNDTAILLGLASKSNGALEVVGQYSTGETYGSILPKDSPNKEAIDQAIEDMRKDGTLDKMASTYLSDIWGADPTKVPYLKP
ncbi:ABC transporter substrate-binding protein [Metarhizobium album]|nr:ABC transporter substrate-binding protein [Rhizobium album]